MRETGQIRNQYRGRGCMLMASFDHPEHGSAERLAGRSTLVTRHTHGMCPSRMIGMLFPDVETQCISISMFGVVAANRVCCPARAPLAVHQHSSTPQLHGACERLHNIHHTCKCNLTDTFPA